MQSRCWQISVYIFTFLMAASVYSQHYITAVAIKPVLLQVEHKVSQQKNMVVFLLPLDIKWQSALSFPSVSPQKYQQQCSSREVCLLVCPCHYCPPILGCSLLYMFSQTYCLWKTEICRGSFFVFFPSLTPSLISIIALSKIAVLRSGACSDYARQILW